MGKHSEDSPEPEMPVNAEAPTRSRRVRQPAKRKSTPAPDDLDLGSSSDEEVKKAPKARKPRAPAKPKAKKPPAPAADPDAEDEGAEDQGDEQGTAPFLGPSTGLWLMKNEPEELSMEILEQKPDKTAPWDGVRNYQARNFVRQMKIGDKLLFYYSSCKVPGIAGIATVVREAYPDHTAWDKDSKYFDEKSTPENPRWDMVDVKYDRLLTRFVPLTELRQHAEGSLQDLALFKRFRLSVMPVSQASWEAILKLEAQAAPAE